MPYDKLSHLRLDSDEEKSTNINPRDTYGNRFEVTSRSIDRKQKCSVSFMQRRFKDKILNFRNETINKSSNINNDKDSFNDDIISNLNYDNSNNKDTSSINKTEDKKIETDSNKSPGLDSLFSSTTNSDIKMQNENVPKKNNQTEENINNVFVGNINSEKKPYLSNIKKSPVSYKNNNVLERDIKVIMPTNFEYAASELSSALKNGSAVVLCTKYTKSEIGKRILDFAFGAASVCDAKVSVVAKMSYAITIGSELSHREKLLCIKEGVPISVDNGL